ncbi:MAG: hypothetical protein ACI9JL_001504 [Paracoccaceae bacterium]|jgi:hypothetical protein
MSEGKVRRVVTGFDETGRSTIVSDNHSPAIKSVPGRPDYYSTNVWRTGAAPVDITEPDLIEAHVGVSPPEKGTVLRVIDFPPEPKDPAERARQLKASFGNIFDDADTSHSSDIHPGMHQTDTVDYAIVLEGEIVAVLEESETVLKTGDILIQRGTNHAWSNQSGASCKVAFILIDGQRS